MRTLVIAPHADDELLGCGGTLLRRRSQGFAVAWVVVTSPTEEANWSSEFIGKRRTEIEHVRLGLGVAQEHLYQLNIPAARVASGPTADLVQRFSEVISEFQATEVFVPHPSDVHSDHRAVFDAVISSAKSFRSPKLKRLLAYETLSETGFGHASDSMFRANCFIDISGFLEEKLRLLRTYESELGDHPFPRSEVAVRALALLRGSRAGVEAAEAFELIWQFE